MEEWQFKAAQFGSMSCTPTLSDQGDDLVTSWKYVWGLCFGFFLFSFFFFLWLHKQFKMFLEVFLTVVMLPVGVTEKWIFTLFLSCLKIWLALWVTTDKKICAEEAACSVCVFKKK